jgi:hypothetical protein
MSAGYFTRAGKFTVCAVIVARVSITPSPLPGRSMLTLEIAMKKEILFVLLCSTMLWAQDKTQVTVKTAENVSGIILVTATENGKRIEFQCTAQQAWCTALKPGTYQLVRLPKNHGMYDCQNVDLFSSAADVDNDQKLGEYCLNQP